MNTFTFSALSCVLITISLFELSFLLLIDCCFFTCCCCCCCCCSSFSLSASFISTYVVPSIIICPFKHFKSHSIDSFAFVVALNPRDVVIRLFPDVSPKPPVLFAENVCNLPLPVVVVLLFVYADGKRVRECKSKSFVVSIIPSFCKRLIVRKCSRRLCGFDAFPISSSILSKYFLMLSFLSECIATLMLFILFFSV